MKKTLRALPLTLTLLLSALLTLLSSCTEDKQELSMFALDTVITGTVYGGREAADAISSEIMRFDSLFGYGEGSDIQKINQAAGLEVAVSRDSSELIFHSLALCRLTNGALDITLGGLMNLWGFSDKQYRVPAENELEEALKTVGFERITVNENRVSVSDGTILDVGAVAKGYIADRLHKTLTEKGVTSAILSLGGNVTAIGSRPDGSDWTVAVLDPDDRESYACLLSVHDTHVVTSGIYQRYFEQEGKRYCHVLDPKTGCPVDNGLASVTVICEDGLTADALSTALLVMGLEKALDFQKNNPVFEAILITTDGKIHSTGIDYRMPQ